MRILKVLTSLQVQAYPGSLLSIRLFSIKLLRLCWEVPSKLNKLATIGPPAIAIQIAFGWWADGGPKGETECWPSRMAARIRKRKIRLWKQSE